MSEHQAPGRALYVLLVCGIGAATLWLVAMVASYGVATATLPFWLAPHVNTLTTTARWRGIPAEFFEFVWALTVIAGAIAALRGDGERRRQILTGLFVGSIPLTGLALWLSMLLPRPLAAMVGGALGAIVVVVSAHQVPARWRGVAMAIRATLTAPAARTTVLAGLAVTVLAGEMIGARTRALTPEQAKDQLFRRGWAATPVTAAQFTADNAIRLVVFTDYECPFCSAAVPRMDETIATFTKDTGRSVDVLIKDYPLESECNRARTDTLHSAACEAAAAVRLVHRQRGPDAAKAFGVSLYENNRQLRDAVRRGIAELGLSAEYTRAYASLLDEVAGEAQLGARLGVRGTPSFFINGRLLRNWRRLDLALRLEHERMAQSSGQP